MLSSLIGVFPALLYAIWLNKKKKEKKATCQATIDYQGMPICPFQIRFFHSLFFKIFYNAGPSQASRHSLTCHDCLCGKEICLSFPKPASSRCRIILSNFISISTRKHTKRDRREEKDKPYLTLSTRGSSDTLIVRLSAIKHQCTRLVSQKGTFPLAHSSPMKTCMPRSKSPAPVARCRPRMSSLTQ